MRAKKSLWPQIEATFKQMDTAATELECFQVLQKQEQLAASHRINNIWAVVEKQKELEKTFQKRYGDLLAEVERTQNTMNQYRAHSNHEEVAAKERCLESAEIASDETSMQGIENHESISNSDGHGRVMFVNSTHDQTLVQQVDLIQTEATSGPENDVDVDADKEQMTRDTDVKVQDATPVVEEEGFRATGVPGKTIDSCIAHRETTQDTGAPEDTRCIARCGEDQDLKNPDNAAIHSHDDKIPETADLD